jgi:hypothetical protein
MKKIFDGKIDDMVHLQFQKFSKGEFKNRALINAKKSGKNYTINAGAEFANELVKTMAERLGNEKTKITGCLISTRDLKGELDFKEIKQFQGVKKYFIDVEMSGRELLSLLEKYPQSFFALSFKAGEDELKIKPKAPKTSKPKNKDEAPKADFCKLKTTDINIARDFIFERPDFKVAEIRHSFLINDLIMPKEEKDFSKVREMTKRKGKILREGKIDDVPIKSEKDFAA